MAKLLGLPLKGSVLRITSNDGKHNAVVKRSGKDWVILYGTYRPVNKSWSRARWGNAAETRADIAHFKEYGTVHKVKGTSWA